MSTYPWSVSQTAYRPLNRETSTRPVDRLALLEGALGKLTWTSTVREAIRLPHQYTADEGSR